MADSPTVLAASIRFQLNQLTSANKHHEFEHLARHLARARVYSNILPATGPVGAGGDGGKDFQTFRVAVSPLTAADSAFVNSASGDKSVAFACSLESKIQPKIRSDIASILADGAIDEVVYFCEANVPIGQRRKLKAWAKARGVELNIFDGVAIAEMLTDRDVFWIAQQYLSLSADQMPARPPEQDWYERLTLRWHAREPAPYSQADFLEVKAGLQHATFNGDARPNLLMWLGKMAAFSGEHTPRSLERTALYELVVANFRGRGEMTSQRAGLENYYADMEDAVGLADLQGAATLLVYAFTAHKSGGLNIDGDTLFAWRGRLLTLLAAEMETAPGPGRKAGLLQVRGHLGLLPSDRDTAPDVASAYADWRLMLEVARDAPLFPVEAFSDFLVGVLKWGFDQKPLLELAAQADEMLQARGGGPSGEKALARAIALIEQNQPVLAIRELHRAKKHWFSGERLDGMLRVFLLLGSNYQEIGLAYAAKYYALAAAYIASHEQRPDIIRLLPSAMHAIVDAEDAAGNSFGLFTTLLAAIGVHVQIDANPLDADEHPWISANLSQLSALLSLLRQAQPALESVLSEPFALWPEPFRTGVLAIVDSEDALWNQGSLDDLWRFLQQSSIDRPFSDLGPRRAVRWGALGLTWTAGFDNTYAVTPIAEAFVAALQLVLAAHATVDLGLAPGDALIEIAVDPAADSIAVSPDGSSAGASVLVTLPAVDLGQHQVAETAAAVVTILRLYSVLDDDTFRNRLNPAMLGELFVARPYAEMFRYFTDEGLFFESVRRASDTLRPDLAWPVTTHNGLAWFDGPGPTYDETEALESIEKRYRTIIAMLQFTLPRLKANPAVHARVRALHDEGRSDWEILGILANLAMNEQLSLDNDMPPTEVEMARLVAIFETAETPEIARDPEIFTAEKLQACSQVYIGAVASSWRLQVSQVLTVRHLEALLVGRYRLRDLDIVHDDIFGWGTEA